MEIFHSFFFNIGNYSSEVSNNQQSEAGNEYYITEGVNNFDIKQKMAWNICFTIYPQICFS